MVIGDGAQRVDSCIRCALHIYPFVKMSREKEIIDCNLLQYLIEIVHVIINQTHDLEQPT